MSSNPNDNIVQFILAYCHAELRQNAGHGPSHTKLALWTYVAETESEAQAGAQ